MDRLFQPFCQIDASTTRTQGGTGLGLAISRPLVEAIGGSIWAESEPGRGSTFPFTVVAPVAAGVVRPPVDADLERCRILLVDDNDTNREIHFGTGDLRILLAEDDEVNQRVGLHLLERLGYRADLAANGVEVIGAIERVPYDVILMDVRMPEMDGLEATRRIRARTDIAQPRIVAMTASVSADDRQDCRAAGMDDCVAKPMRPEELAAALGRAGGTEGTVTHGGPRLDVAREEAAAPPPAVDSSVLAKLLGPLGERAPIAEVRLIDTYLSELAKLIKQLQEALDAGNRDSLSRAAHTLGSSSANMGAVRLSQRCADLEHRSRDAIPDHAAASIRNIAVEGDRVAQALGARRRQLPS